MAKGLLVEFYLEAIEMGAASAAAGRPIYEDKTFVRIQPIGDQRTVMCKPATPEMQQKYPEEWAAFQRNEATAYKGTPLKEWPPMTPSRIKTLNGFNVYTVEHLAEISDVAINQIGPGTRELVQKAKAFLVQAKDGAAAAKYAAENEQLRNEIDALKADFAKLSSKKAA